MRKPVDVESDVHIFGSERRVGRQLSLKKRKEEGVQGREGGGGEEATATTPSNSSSWRWANTTAAAAASASKVSNSKQLAEDARDLSTTPTKDEEEEDSINSNKLKTLQQITPEYMETIFRFMEKGEGDLSGQMSPPLQLITETPSNQFEIMDEADKSHQRQRRRRAGILIQSPGSNAATTKQSDQETSFISDTSETTQVNLDSYTTGHSSILDVYSMLQEVNENVEKGEIQREIISSRSKPSACVGPREIPSHMRLNLRMAIRYDALLLRKMAKLPTASKSLKSFVSTEGYESESSINSTSGNSSITTNSSSVARKKSVFKSLVRKLTNK